MIMHGGNLKLKDNRNLLGTHPVTPLHKTVLIVDMNYKLQMEIDILNPSV